MVKKYDPIQEYLRGRGAASHVVRLGFKGLADAWAKVASELVFDGYRFGLRDFINDLDRREILEGALAVEKQEPRPDLMRLIDQSDQRYRDATHEANRCLVDDETAAEIGITRDRHWWYFRFPRRYRGNFGKDLEKAGIRPLSEEQG